MFGEKLAAFYRQLASMLEVGVPPTRALGTLASSFPGAYGRGAERMRQVVDSGGTVADAARAVPSMIVPMHVRLIEVGEHSGRTHEVLVSLAEALEANAVLMKSLITRLLYPLLILHLAIGVMAVVFLFTAGVGAAVSYLLSMFLPGYGFAFMLWMLWKARFAIPPIGAVVDYSFYYIPIVGGVTRNLSIARFSRTYESLYTAGVSMIDGLDMAADACGNRLMARRLRSALPMLRDGSSLAEALPATGAFNPVIASMLVTGAETGKMHIMLKKIAEQAQFNAQQSIERLGRIIPLLLYLIIMGFIVFLIFSVLSIYIGELNAIMDEIG